MSSALMKTRARLRPERGATAVEYVLMVAIVAAVVVLVVALLGGGLRSLAGLGVGPT